MGVVTRALPGSSFLRKALTLAAIFCAGTSVFCADTAMAGPIYVIKEKDGTLRFTNKAPAAGDTYQKFTAKRGSVSWIRGGHGYRGKLYPNVYNTLISEAALVHKLSPDLVRAVIHAESGFNPKALSPKGARGLMQLMPGTAKELGVKNSYDPNQNVHGGTKYLAGLLKRYAGNTRKALAAYNAGPGAVDQHRGIPPFSETISYVNRVLALAQRYSSSATSQS